MTDYETKRLIRKLKQSIKEKSYLEKQIETKIKQAACSACNCTIEMFDSGERYERAVMARNLVAWYYFEKAKYNKTHSGYIINRNHATVLRAINILNDNLQNGLKFYKPQQREWIIEFQKLIE